MTTRVEVEIWNIKYLCLWSESYPKQYLFITSVSVGQKFEHSLAEWSCMGFLTRQQSTRGCSWLMAQLGRILFQGHSRGSRKPQVLIGIFPETTALSHVGLSTEQLVAQWLIFIRVSRTRQGGAWGLPALHDLTMFPPVTQQQAGQRVERPFGNSVTTPVRSWDSVSSASVY